jgi:hypothetical protein
MCVVLSVIHRASDGMPAATVAAPPFWNAVTNNDTHAGVNNRRSFHSGLPPAGWFTACPDAPINAATIASPPWPDSCRMTATMNASVSTMLMMARSHGGIPLSDGCTGCVICCFPSVAWLQGFDVAQLLSTALHVCRVSDASECQSSTTVDLV